MLSIFVYSQRMVFCMQLYVTEQLHTYCIAHFLSVELYTTLEHTSTDDTLCYLLCEVNILKDYFSVNGQLSPQEHNQPKTETEKS